MMAKDKSRGRDKGKAKKKAQANATTMPASKAPVRMTTPKVAGTLKPAVTFGATPASTGDVPSHHGVNKSGGP
jgi:hypothetical protein